MRGSIRLRECEEKRKWRADLKEIAVNVVLSLRSATVANGGPAVLVSRTKAI